MIILIILALVIIALCVSFSPSNADTELLEMLAEDVAVAQDHLQLVKHVATLIEKPVKESKPDNICIKLHFGLLH